ncbi:SubName: Full=Uncharacterized protein {ECO:0000313/EMBL:CCA72957.1} [Serendipita indica DSM 11827]|nr:SubName: Full=Uncharacterized protein {ECO:0000313/EMBL:CCA72957.1} [Serendipita indica DSM 11827]
MFWKRKKQAGNEHTGWDALLSAQQQTDRYCSDDCVSSKQPNCSSGRNHPRNLSASPKRGAFSSNSRKSADISYASPNFGSTIRFKSTSSVIHPSPAELFCVLLHLYLANWLLCPQRIIANNLMEQDGDTTCRCDEIDDAFGSALTALDQLESLRLYCNLCYDPRTSNRHRSLARLGSRQLKEFVFRCNCVILCKWNSSEIVTQDAINGVEAFSLEWTLRVKVPFHPRILQQNSKILKNITTLNYNRAPHCKALVETRSITRLVVSVAGALAYRPEFDGLHDILSTSGRHLTHFYMGDVGNWLQRSLSLDISPYRTLEVLGVLLVPVWQADAILHAVEVLSPLKLLRTLEFFGQTERSPLPGDVLQTLTERHPQLQKVYLQFSVWRPQSAAVEVVWEREESDWTFRDIETIHWWDIVRKVGH